MATTPPPPSDAALRENIGPYKILKNLGSGNMGTVYLAHPVGQPTAPVALKVLNKVLITDTDAYARFAREIEIGRSLASPNVCAVLDAGHSSDGLSYVAMEYLDGITLDQLIKERAPMALPMTLSWMRQLLQGLQAIHQAGVIHRDIKPDNIFITTSGTLKILDFGLANVAMFPTRLGVALTRTGTMLGTPRFVSPEQVLDAKRADKRSDLFSAGAVFYSMLTGKPAFEGEVWDSVQATLMADGGPSLVKARPDLPAWVEAWKTALMRRDPDQRVQSADEAIALLDAPH